MLPVGPNFPPGGQAYAYGPSGQPFSMSGPTQPFLPQDQLHHATAADPNSSQAFKQNLANVHNQVIQLQDAARRTLAGIQNAYQSGYSPTHTQAEMATLKQALQLTVDLARQTGVGALPILPEDTSSPPSEQQLLENTSKALQALYDQLQRGQESAQVAANLLSLEQRPTK